MNNNMLSHFERDMADLAQRYDALLSEMLQPSLSAQGRSDRMHMGRVMNGMAERKIVAMTERMNAICEQWKARKAKLAEMRAAEERRIRDERATAIRAYAQIGASDALQSTVILNHPASIRFSEDVQHGGDRHDKADHSVSSCRPQAVAHQHEKLEHELLLPNQQPARRSAHRHDCAARVLSARGDCGGHQRARHH